MDIIDDPTPLDPTADVNATVELHRLCEECKCIGRTLPSAFARLREQGSKPWRIEFQHYGNVAALRVSVKKGCHLCAKMWGDIPNKEGAMQRQNYEVSLIFRRSFSHDRGHHYLELGTRDGQYRLGSVELRRSSCTYVLLLSSLLEQGIGSFQLMFTPVEYLDQWYKASGVSAQRLCSVPRHCITTGSDHLISLASHWINICLNTHSGCRFHARSQFPTRLIDVGPSDESTLLRLRESDFGAEAHYTALSYCWGKVDTLKLTNRTYQHLSAGIEMDLLPRTYRDAVVIIRKLGFQYLWVDALCILQDSKKDWERESAKMSDVCSGSVVTIGAVWGTNGNAGLFVQRDLLSQWPCKVEEIPGETFFAPSRDPTFGMRADWDWSLDSRRRKPLFTRGWALQERLLSTRILFYGPDELHWECHTGEASEVWPNIGESFYPVGGMIDYSGNQQMTLKSFGELPSIRDPLKDIMLDLPYLKTFFSNWNLILQRYWRTSLTYPTDGLVALSGITQYIGTLTGLTFYAGAWLELLPFDLLWWMRPFKEGQRVSCFPSWSWAGTSGEGRVVSPGGRSILSQRNHDTTYFSKFRPCEPKGALEISGFVLFTQLYITSGRSAGNLEEIEQLKFSLAVLDSPNPGGLLDVVCLLLVQWRNEHSYHETGYYHSEGLFLVPTNNKTDEYQRIGLWYLWDEHDNRAAIVSKFRYETITLV